MNAGKVAEIKELISKCEIESAKSQGIIETIKNDWKKEFGTDDPAEIKEKLQELKIELETSNERMESLYNKLLESYDWDSLESELE